eukprot:8638397-Heterocapsa_arctica.AAC.1
MARCVAAGGFWGESRIFLAGYRPDPICRRCFADDDSDLHMFWLCPANDLLDDPAVTFTQTLIPEAIANSEEYACFWFRGLIPCPWIQLPRPEDECQGKWICGKGYADLDGGSFATDGSGG